MINITFSNAAVIQLKIFNLIIRQRYQGIILSILIEATTFKWELSNVLFHWKQPIYKEFDYMLNNLTFSTIIIKVAEIKFNKGVIIILWTICKYCWELIFTCFTIDIILKFTPFYYYFELAWNFLRVFSKIKTKYWQTVIRSYVWEGWFKYKYSHD